MEYTIAKEHYDFFHKNGAVEFEEVFSPEQLAEANDHIDALISAALPKSLRYSKPEETFRAGHDLWREDPLIKKYFAHKRWAKIAADLTDSQTIRLGCDQLLPAGYALCQGAPLKEITSFQGVICGAIFTLKEGPQHESNENENEIAIPSRTAGNLIFFKKELPLDFSSLEAESEGRYLLVVYTDAKTVYTHNEKDAHTHALKYRGYVFGDRLNDTLNPILYRRRG